LRAPRQRPSLGRLRRGELPGIRVESRPYVAIAAVILSIGASIAVPTSSVSTAGLASVGTPTGHRWPVATAPVVYLPPDYAVVVALIPRAAQEADWLAAAGGAAIGLLSGLALMLARRG